MKIGADKDWNKKSWPLGTWWGKGKNYNADLLTREVKFELWTKQYSRISGSFILKNHSDIAWKRVCKYIYNALC